MGGWFFAVHVAASERCASAVAIMCVAIVRVRTTCNLPKALVLMFKPTRSFGTGTLERWPCRSTQHPEHVHRHAQCIWVQATRIVCACVAQ